MPSPQPPKFTLYSVVVADISVENIFTKVADGSLHTLAALTLSELSHGVLVLSLARLWHRHPEALIV